MIEIVNRTWASRPQLAVVSAIGLGGMLALANFGFSTAREQISDDKHAIHELVREAGEQHGVNHVRVPPDRYSAAVEHWLDQNRESIEGTRGGPFDPTPQYVSTFSGNRIYVHVLDWSGKNNVRLPAVINRPVKKAWLLDGGAPVRVDQAPWGMLVVVPKEQRPGEFDTVVVLEMPGDVEDLRQARLIAAVPSKPVLLLGDTAKISGNTIRYNPSPDWIEGWTSTSDSIAWRVRVPSAETYSVALTYSCAPGCGGAKIEISANGRDKVIVNTQETQGVWEGWQAFERIPVAGSLSLEAGVNTITLRALRKSGTMEIIRLNSLALLSPNAQRAAQEAAKRARAVRADTGWLRNAKYGLMVHWLPNTMPRFGPRKEFCDAARDFNVERFADMVSGTGAGYLIFTLAQLQYFAMPLHAADVVLPDRTCPDRDLIGGLANAMYERNVFFILYYHHGVGDTEWSRAAGFLQSDKSRFFQHELAILSEIGQRYGDRLAGWWFDDRYPFQPFEQLNQAAKLGNPDRIVAFNSWILPKSTDFQDYWAGELGGELTSLPASAFFDQGGPASGLQPHVLVYLDDPWLHGAQNTPISPPRFTHAQLIRFIRDSNKKRAPVTMNIGVYQDGTASPETLSQLSAVRESIRGD